MKTLTVRLPDEVAAQIEAESRERKLSKSDIIRERLTRERRRPTDPLESISDIIGSVHGLPVDLSARKKKYLKAGYGRKHSR